MRTILLTAAAVLVVTYCRAQVNAAPRSNSLSFELGKIGLVFNLTYDHRFTPLNVGIRAGVGSNFAQNVRALTTGAGAYYLVGTSTRFLELGAGIQYLSIEETSDDQKGFVLLFPDYPVETLYPDITVGYRRYGKNTLFRLGFSGALIKSDLVPGGYLSFGFTF